MPVCPVHTESCAQPLFIKRNRIQQMRCTTLTSVLDAENRGKEGMKSYISITGNIENRQIVQLVHLGRLKEQCSIGRWVSKGITSFSCITTTRGIGHISVGPTLQVWFEETVSVFCHGTHWLKPASATAVYRMSQCSIICEVALWVCNLICARWSMRKEYNSSNDCLLPGS